MTQEWSPYILEPCGHSARKPHRHEVLFSDDDFEAAFDQGDVKTETAKVQRMPLEVATMTMVMLPELRPAAPPYIHTKAHRAIERAHEHAHSEAKKVGDTRDANDFEKHVLATLRQCLCKERITHVKLRL